MINDKIQIVYVGTGKFMEKSMLNKGYSYNSNLQYLKKDSSKRILKVREVCLSEIFEVLNLGHLNITAQK